MMKYSKEQILKRYKNLPKRLQDIIFAKESAEILQKIGKEKGLNIEEIGILADETGLVLLGFTPPQEYIPNLEKRLKINREKAKEIAREINNQIFAKVREELKKIYKIKPTPTKTPKKIPKPEIITPQKEPEILNSQPTKLEEPEEKENQVIRPRQSETETKDIIKEKTKEGLFRSKPEISKIKPLNPKYPNGIDPYREPIE